MSDLDHPTPDQPRLSEADAAALDRIMESGLSSPGGPREQRLADLLGLLGTPVAGEADRATRADIIQVRARRAAVSEAESQHLGAEDAAALDRWMEGDCSQDQPGLQPRIGRHEAFAALISSGPVSSPEQRHALIERTLMAAQAAEREQQRSLRFEEHAGAAGGARFRLADLISVAAMLLIVASIGLPAFQGAARYREQAACMSNMRASAQAFGAYAGANADMLPMATAGFGGSWMDVGNPNRSNSANLYTLPREQYLRLDDLACPTNPNAPRGTPVPGSMDWRSMEEISYSYRIMSNGGLRMSVAVPTTTRVVVMADRSPVTLRVARGQVVFPEANTPNHDGRGQHVLRLDGSTAWAKTPVIEGDNIWLPRQIEEIIRQVRSQMGVIQGNEMPASETDAFVGP